MINYRYLIATLLLIFPLASMSEPEMKFECEASKQEYYNEVSITITRCIDSYGPASDGMYEFYYDYETIKFEIGSESISGKRYTDTPAEASLIRIKNSDGERLIEIADFEKKLLKDSISYLKANGAKSVKYLDRTNKISGYSEVPNE